MPVTIDGSFSRLEHHEFRIGRHLFDAAEQPGQLGVVAQVAVADYPQFTASDQRRSGLLEHAPGEEVTDHLLLVERRVTQYQVQRAGRLLGLRRSLDVSFCFRSRPLTRLGTGLAPFLSILLVYSGRDRRELVYQELLPSSAA